MSDPSLELMRHPFHELVIDVRRYIDNSGLSKYILRDVGTSLHEARQLAKIGHYDRNQMPVCEPSDLDKINDMLAAHGIPDSMEYAHVSVRPERLVPLQHQLHVDKVVDAVKQEGRLFYKLVQKAPVIVTGDMHILDGHHRWLCAMMSAKKFQLSVFIIAAQTEDVLPLLLEWSDKHHARNT